MEKICLFCWSKFIWSYANQRFCSLGCSSKNYWVNARKKAIDDYISNPNKCIECWWIIEHKKWSVTQTRRKNFCSQKCSTIYWNKNRNIKRTWSCEISCKWCWKTFKRKWIKNVFCWTDCMWKFRANKFREDVNKKLDSWENVWLKTWSIKPVIINRRWYRCECCKNSEWMWKNIPLELHHIDWDSKNNTDKNLMLICPNCHTFTDNYKSKNKNATRIR